MTSVEAARGYCEALGKDPDEEVFGYFSQRWISAPRWRWFLGAHPCLAQGATELSPEQVRRREARRG